MKTLTTLLVGFVVAAPAIAAPLVSGVAAHVVARQPGGRGCVREPCYKPAAGVTVTFTRGTQVLRATSDRNGRFRLVLAPGLWTVRAPGLVTVGGRARVIRIVEGRVMPLSLVVSRLTTALR